MKKNEQSTSRTFAGGNATFITLLSEQTEHLTMVIDTPIGGSSLQS